MVSPGQGSPAAISSSSIAKRRRVLACVQCQQRKVKCSRKFPCENCVKSHTRCEPSVAPRPRRRRFPERELLDRVRRYESLLRQNNIQFEPLHKDLGTMEKLSRNPSVGDDGGYESADDEKTGLAARLEASSSPSSTIGRSESAYTAKDVWSAMNQRSPDSDDDSSESSPEDVNARVVTSSWAQMFPNSNQLLFGPPGAAVDLSSLHPDQVQIFKLWQVYLDNVNPLLKVTHTPTLQGRIINAAGNVANIPQNLEALMFSIYCVSVMSLSESECLAMLGSPKEDTLMGYQFGCQQALSNCGFLRTSNRECLTALYLYLVSVRPNTDPNSLSSMLRVAIRIAQRMGLHIESTYAKSTAFDAEMSRKLWWSMISFDARICEKLPDYKSVLLIPTWDCNVPLNINDFDLQPEMKGPPTAQTNSTDALFVVVRSEIGECVRHSSYHLDFVLPAFKSIAKDIERGPAPYSSELTKLEELIEQKYLKFCNPENPLHFMTIWMARSQLAKYHLLETFSKFNMPFRLQTDEQRDTALNDAIVMLECDTKLMNSPITKGFQWFLDMHFPFPGYLHGIQDLKKRPTSCYSDRAWEAMSSNFEARSMTVGHPQNVLFKMFSKMILQAWKARELLAGQSEGSVLPSPPRIVVDIKKKVAPPATDVQFTSNTQQQQQQQQQQQSPPMDISDMTIDEYLMSMPTNFGSQDMLYGMGGGQGFGGMEAGLGQLTSDIDMNQFNWNAMDWNRGW